MLIKGGQNVKTLVPVMPIKVDPIKSQSAKVGVIA